MNRQAGQQCLQPLLGHRGETITAAGLGSCSANGDRRAHNGSVSRNGDDQISTAPSLA